MKELNAEGHSVLYLAVTEGTVQAVEMLIDANVNKNTRCTVELYTPLIAAILNDRMKMVNILIKVSKKKSTWY